MKKEILKVYESFNGSYWYLCEFLYEQEDDYSEHDKIYFGYAVLSGLEQFAEWGNIAEAEILKVFGNQVWEVPKSDWKLCNHYDRVVTDLGIGKEVLVDEQHKLEGGN